MDVTKISLIIVILCSSTSKVFSHVATSHQSIVSGEGWRYGYGVVNNPYGISYISGESYPHGYGGLGAYAPTFTYLNPSIYFPQKSYYLKVPHEVISPPHPLIINNALGYHL